MDNEANELLPTRIVVVMIGLVFLGSGLLTNCGTPSGQSSTAKTSEEPVPVDSPGLSLPAPKSDELRIVSLSLMVYPPSFSGPCPTKIKFFGQIKAKGVGDVTYRFETDDGGEFPRKTVHFDKSGIKDVYLEFVHGDWFVANQPISGSASLVILEPTEMESDEAYFTVVCQN